MNSLSRSRLTICASAASLALVAYAYSAHPTRRVSTTFERQCNVGQGYNFNQDEHPTFGYITQLSIGDNDVSPDIKVVEPTSLKDLRANAGTTGGTSDTSVIFKRPVVAVLSTVSWSTLPNENISLQGRISLANAQQLQMLTMQSTKKLVMRIAYVVYEYDLVNQCYYPTFGTKLGVAPSGTKPPKATNGGFGNRDSTAIYALVGKTSAAEFGIKVGHKAEEDPLGIKNHTIELTLAPPISSSPQQIQIQTSSTIKLIQPWGLPQR